MVAHKGNKYAAKPESERASKSFTIRIRRKDKEQWEAVAKKAGKSLSQWLQDEMKAIVEAEYRRTFGEPPSKKKSP